MLRWNLGLDFLFILGYAPAIGLGSLLVSDLAGKPWIGAVGVVLAWLQVAAGLLDAVENLCLLRAVTLAEKGDGGTWPAPAARVSALVKFALVGAGLFWVLPVWVYRLLW